MAVTASDICKVQYSRLCLQADTRLLQMSSESMGSAEEHEQLRQLCRHLPGSQAGDGSVCCKISWTLNLYYFSGYVLRL